MKVQPKTNNIEKENKFVPLFCVKFLNSHIIFAWQLLLNLKRDLAYFINEKDNVFIPTLSIDTLLATQTQIKSIDNFLKLSKAQMEKTLYQTLYNNQYFKTLIDLERIIEIDQANFKEIHTIFNKINLLLSDIQQKTNKKIVSLNNKNYDVIKFDSNNDICTKIDPISKSIINGKNHKFDTEIIIIICLKIELLLIILKY